MHDNVIMQADTNDRIRNKNWEKSQTHEIYRGINLAWTAFGKLSSVPIRLKPKFNVYDQCVLPETLKVHKYK